MQNLCIRVCILSRSPATCSRPFSSIVMKREEKGVIEDEMVGWHHQLNEQEFEQTPGDSEGQGHKESDLAEQLKNSNNNK